jgi:hypothetical protein
MSDDENTLFAGSSPAMRTKNPQEIEDSQGVCTEFAQNQARSPDKRVKFPVSTPTATEAGQ